MNALKLASLISVTLTCLAPMSLAQSSTATAVADDGTTRTEPGDRVTYKEQKVAGDDVGSTTVRPDPGHTVTWRKAPLAGIGEERTSQREQSADTRPAMELTMAREDSGALRLQVSPMDRNPAWIVVCFATERGLVPVAALDARNDAQTTFHLDLDEFASMPLAMFAARFTNRGYLEFSPVKTSAELADDAQ